MKKFTQTTLIALLIGTFVFAQKGSPGNQAAPSQTTVIVGALRGTVILLSPADGKSIAASDASKPVLFRWTTVVPKPKEAVTYRLKVWQLMQGQSGTEAMRNNQPIITKDVVNITQAAISNLYTGPCKPPYLCDFVWGIEVLNSEGVTIGNSYAANSSFKFEVGNTVAENVEGVNKGNAGNTGMSGGKSTDRDAASGLVTGKRLDKESDKNQSNAKRVNDCCLNPCCSEKSKPAILYLPIEKTVYDSNGNISEIMIRTETGKLVVVKAVVAGSNSLSGGIMLKTEKGEPIIAKVVVAGSHSISGGVK